MRVRFFRPGLVLAVLSAFVAEAAQAERLSGRFFIRGQHSYLDGGRFITESEAELVSSTDGLSGQTLVVHSLGGRIGDFGQVVVQEQQFSAGETLELELERDLAGDWRTSLTQAPPPKREEFEQPAWCIPAAASTNQVQPFVCTRTRGNSGPSLAWLSRQATYKLNRKGTDDIAGDSEFAVIRQAFAAWQGVSDSLINLEDGGFTDSSAVGFDLLDLPANENIVVFQTTWPHVGQQMALTTLTYNFSTGEIVDADIEVNDERYQLSVGDEAIELDLLNLLTHEVGHFVGFAHTDDDPAIANECALLATMHSQNGRGEINKRTLAPSDEHGLRFVYPAIGNIGRCAPPESTPVHLGIKQVGSRLPGKGCSQSQPDDGPLHWLLLTAWFLWRSASPRKAKLRRGAAYAGLLLAVGCGQAPVHGAPTISEFSYAQQFPGEPLAMVFTIGFASADGTLGAGSILFDFNDKPQLELSMQPLLQARSLPLDSQSGHVAALVRLTSAPAVNSRNRIGIRLRDSIGRISLRAEVTLEFTD